VMEYVEGIALSQMIAEEKHLDADLTAEIARQVADALEHAHCAGIVHRDIKPSNILITKLSKEAIYSPQSIAVKVVDFGIASLQRDKPDEQSLTRTGQVLGSPLYMSPEQCLGGKCDARSDIYSLGCVIYEALSGKVPLMGKTFGETIIKHTKEKPKPFSDELQVPQQIQKIVFSALEKNVADRFQSMTEMRSALESFQKGQAVKIRRTSKMLLNLSIFFICMIIPALYLTLQAVIMTEPVKSAQVVCNLKLPELVNWILFPTNGTPAAIQAVRIAEANYDQKNYQAAEQVLKGAASADPKYVPLTVWPLAKALAMQHKYGELEEVLLRMGGSQTGLARNLHILAHTLMNSEGRNTEPLHLFQRASDIYRAELGDNSYEFAKDTFNLALCQSHQGQNKEANVNFKTAYEILRNQPNVDPALFADVKRMIQ
ncbi:MAG: serine/threonine protein kinase, partial [Leptolyngbya sp.]|nr:serine/threonine protein kinase [Candidatus Melainabacteria bacterium]